MPRTILVPLAVLGIMVSVLPIVGAHAQMTTGPQVSKTHGLGLPRDRDQLVVPDEGYARRPLLPSQQQYKDIDGLKIKARILEITAISNKSRDAGDILWGRIVGTPYDKMTTDWLMTQFNKLGMQNVHREEFAAAPVPFPTALSASFTVDGKSENLATIFPITGTKGTPPGGATAEAIWLGLGTAADFLGRDVKGKAVVVYSILRPGSRSHSAGNRGYDAIKRANEAGAAMVISIMAVPGNGLFEPEGAEHTLIPAMTLSQDEGKVLRDLLGAGKRVSINLNLSIEVRENQKTANVFGTLPGMSEEQVFVIGHTDSFFQGASDNAAGMSMMVEIAHHYAALPRSKRPRTMVFVGTPDHHHGDVGAKQLIEKYDWSKVALIANCEHPAEALVYQIGEDLMTSNAINARVLYVNGSDALRKLVSKSLRDFDVSVLTVPSVIPKGMVHFLPMASSFAVGTDSLYHTTIDTPEIVPAWGLENATRAYLQIIDSANAMTMEALKQ